MQRRECASAGDPSAPSPRATPLQWAVFAASLVIGIYLCWLIVRPFVNALLWAATLVALLHPVHRRVARHVSHAGLAAAVSSLLVVILVVLPTALVVTAVVDELTRVAAGLPQTTTSWLAPSHPVTGAWISWIERYVSLDRLRETRFAPTQIETLGVGLAQSSARLLGGVVGVVLQTLLVLFTMFYFFRDGDRFRQMIDRHLPLSSEQTRTLMRRTSDVITASVYGNLLLAGLQGALGGLAFWVVGLSAPLLWGVVMMVLSIIPMLGSFVVWAPAAVYLFLTDHWIRAVGLVVWGIVVVGGVDNLLRPRLVGHQTQMHDLLVFFGVLGGIQLFGALGLVMGPVIIAITMALIEAASQVPHESWGRTERTDNRGPR